LQVPEPGMVDDISPLAFDAGALSDYLVNQAAAPDWRWRLWEQGASHGRMASPRGGRL
jgi:hypothetical protein